jgi:hypothetical protein
MEKAVDMLMRGLAVAAAIILWLGAFGVVKWMGWI